VLPSDLNGLSHEILVVDESVDSRIRNEIRKMCSDNGMQYVREPSLGISKARNRGIQESSGSIILFVDDDVIVERTTIKALTENYRAKDIVSCSGRVLSLRADYNSTLFEKYGSFDRGPDRFEVTSKDMRTIRLFVASLTRLMGRYSRSRNPPPYSFGGALYSFRRTVFAEVGDFHALLIQCPLHREVASELDMYYKILREGHKIVYEPRAIAYHDHRKTFKEIIGVSYSNGCAYAALSMTHFADGPYVGMLLLGDLFLSLFSTLKATIKGRRDLRTLHRAHLMGICHALFSHRATEKA
jgi:glycosyltransferase involved in cell wall biosynthesis